MTKKTNLLFCVLLSALLFAACSYNNHNLFYSNSLNEELCLFIDTTRIEGANNYYQVNIGLNTLGAKITFVHSSSNPYGSVYWYSHSEPQYIGYHILEKDTVRVYASPPKVSHVIRLSTLKINNKDEADKVLSSLGNTFVVESVDSKDKAKNSKFPFITSTLQQEASTKLGF